jgi:Protein of unknown function (DUF3108)
MRAVSLCATVVLVATAISVAGQQPAPTQPPPRRPPAPAPRSTPAQKPAPAPAKEAAVPFSVGETLTYDVGWSTFLVAGSAISRVVEKRPSSNSSAYYIVAEGRPLPIIARLYALYYKMDSLVDSYTTLSHRTSLYTEEGSRKRSATTTFDRAAKRAQFTVQTDKPLEFPVPANVQDGLATLYALRSRNLKTGDRVSIPVTDEGMLYSANFEVGAPEQVKVPLGTINAWSLKITVLDAANQPVGKNIAAWISTDPRRLPVRLQADLPVGNFALTLRSAQ